MNQSVWYFAELLYGLSDVEKGGYTSFILSQCLLIAGIYDISSRATVCLEQLAIVSLAEVCVCLENDCVLYVSLHSETLQSPDAGDR